MSWERDLGGRPAERSLRRGAGTRGTAQALGQGGGAPTVPPRAAPKTPGLPGCRHPRHRHPPPPAPPLLPQHVLASRRGRRGPPSPSRATRPAMWQRGPGRVSPDNPAFERGQRVPGDGGTRRPVTRRRMALFWWRQVPRAVTRGAGVQLPLCFIWGARSTRAAVGPEKSGCQPGQAGDRAGRGRGRCGDGGDTGGDTSASPHPWASALPWSPRECR